MEQLNLDPYVAYVHEVLTESEMQMFKDHAKGRMERSKIGQVCNAEFKIQTVPKLLLIKAKSVKNGTQSCENVSALYYFLGALLYFSQWGLLLGYQ